MAWFTALPRKLRTARRFSLRELALVSEAWVRLAWVRMRLRVAPYVWSRSILQRAALGDPPPHRCDPELRNLPRMVRIAARNHPWSMSCLHRSLVLHDMLRRRGVPALLRFGVRWRGDELNAHAWVECGGAVVNDAPDVAASFMPLEGPADGPSHRDAAEYLDANLPRRWG